MPFSRDPLTTIEQRIKSDFELHVKDEQGNAIDATSPGTGYTEFAEVIAGVAHELYGNQAWIAKQISLHDADEERLVDEAATLGIPRIPPQYSGGTLTFTGNSGVLIAADRFLQDDSGALFKTTADVTTASGTAQATIVAMEAGLAGNLVQGSSLTLLEPIVGIDNTATVDAPGLSGGADIEAIERLRERVIARKQEPPMGGNSYDYVAWAKAASVDVTRAWPFFHENGIGSVVVRFVTEDLASPIPTQPIIDVVSAFMDTVRPAGTRNFVVEAPTAKPMNLTFSSLMPNTPEVQTAINAELLDLIRLEGKPGSIIPISKIREAISRATGEQDYNISLNTDISYSDSQFPTLGTTTWPGA